MTIAENQLHSDPEWRTSVAYETSALPAPVSGWPRLAAQICAAPAGFMTVISDADWQIAGACADATDLSLAQRVVAGAAAQHVCARGQSLFLPDTRQFWCGPNTPPALTTILSLAAAPVFKAGRLRPFAVIGAMDTSARTWRDAHRYGLETLAMAISRFSPS